MFIFDFQYHFLNNLIYTETAILAYFACHDVILKTERFAPLLCRQQYHRFETNKNNFY